MMKGMMMKGMMMDDMPMQGMMMGMHGQHAIMENSWRRLIKVSSSSAPANC